MTFTHAHILKILSLAGLETNYFKWSNFNTLYLGIAKMKNCIWTTPTIFSRPTYISFFLSIIGTPCILKCRFQTSPFNGSHPSFLPPGRIHRHPETGDIGGAEACPMEPVNLLSGPKSSFIYKRRWEIRIFVQMNILRNHLFISFIRILHTN